MLYDEFNYDYGSAATADYFLVGEHAAGENFLAFVRPLETVPVVAADFRPGERHCCQGRHCYVTVG